MTKTCECGQTQIKLCQDDSGNEWYNVSFRNGSTGEYGLDYTTGWIMHQDDVFFSCQSPDCSTEFVMDDHVYSIPSDEVFAELHAKHGKWGALLRGVRYHMGMDIQTFAHDVLTISDYRLRDMEDGTIPVDETIKRILREKFDWSEAVE